MQAIVVTGVSSGIGRAILDIAVKNGTHVFGSVRGREDADDLADFGPDRVTPLIFDSRDEKAVAKAARTVRTKLDGAPLFGLVNNAGTGLVGPFLHQPMEEFRTVFDTNVIGTLQVSRAFVPLLMASTPKGRPGRVVNMSSLAGKFSQPFAGAYVASKHAIEGLSETMRIELNLYGIKVVVVGPSSVGTPIWDHAEVALGKYAKTDYGDAFDKAIGAIVDSSHKRGLASSKVAAIVWEALTARRPKLRYSPAAHPIIEQALPRILPERITSMFFEKQLGLEPKAAKLAREKTGSRSGAT